MREVFFIPRYLFIFPELRHNFVLLTIPVLLLYGCAGPGKEVKLDANKSIEAHKRLNTITSIELKDKSLLITTDSPFEYRIYSPEDPFKIIVEMDDVDCGVYIGEIVSPEKNISTILLTQRSVPRAGTKMEITLSSLHEFTHSYSDNTLTIALEEIMETVKEQVMEDIELLPRLSEADIPLLKDIEPPLPAKNIIGLSMEHAPDALKVILYGDGFFVPDVFKLKDRVVVDIPNVAISASKPEKLYAPLKKIRWAEHKEKSRIVFDLKKEVAHMVFPMGESAILLLAEPETIESHAGKLIASTVKYRKPAPEEKIPLDNKLISLDFQDADIVPIFKLLTEISGYNIVVHPDVTGKITMKLTDVPWNKVLNLILKSHNLDKDVDENIISISPSQAFHSEGEVTDKLRESVIIEDFNVNIENSDLFKKYIDNPAGFSAKGKISIDMNISFSSKDDNSNTEDENTLQKQEVLK